jgi:O-antigen/teichoic acid export membrane protein
LLKRSRTVLLLTLGAALFNVTLNLLMIPWLGVFGAACSTLASFIVLNVARYATCPRELRALPELRATLTAVGLGALCVLIARDVLLVHLDSHLARLLAMVLVMLGLYVLPALAFDARLRAQIFHRAESSS